MSIGARKYSRGHFITLRRFLLMFWRDIRAGNGLNGGAAVHYWSTFPPALPKRGKETTVRQDFKTDGLFTVEYPDERLPVYERFRVLPVLIYDTEDGNVYAALRATSAPRSAPHSASGWRRQRARKGRSCPCPRISTSTWTSARTAGSARSTARSTPSRWTIISSCPTTNGTRPTFSTMQDLLVWSEFYAKTHPQAWKSMPTRPPNETRWPRRRIKDFEKMPWPSSKPPRPSRHRQPSPPRREFGLLQADFQAIKIIARRSHPPRQSQEPMIPSPPSPSYPPGTRVRVTQHVRVGHRRWMTHIEGVVTGEGRGPVGGIEMGGKASYCHQPTLQLERDDGELSADHRGRGDRSEDDLKVNGTRSVPTTFNQPKMNNLMVLYNYIFVGLLLLVAIVFLARSGVHRVFGAAAEADASQGRRL